MAQIRKRGDTYQIIVFLGRDSEQKEIVKRTTYTPQASTPKAIEKEVKDFARDYERRVRSGDVLEEEGITFSEFVEIWKENWLPAKTTRVQEEYIAMIERKFIPAFGFMPIDRIRATHIDRVLTEMKKAGKAPKTIRHNFTAINSVMKYAYKKQYIRENPCLRCDDLPKVVKNGELHYFTIEQTKAFFRALDMSFSTTYKAHTRTLAKTGEKYTVPEYTETRTVPTQFKAYFYLAIYGGFRRGELCALTWEDIDFDSKTISINKAFSKLMDGTQEIKCPKTNAGIREVSLPEVCFQVLRRWRAEQKLLSLRLGSAWEGAHGKDFDKNYIFISLENGRPMNIDTPGHKFHEIIDAYNETVEKEEEKLPKIRLHDLRHTSATLLIANNADIATVSHRLGHSKVSTTLDIYVHPTKNADEEASNTLERLFA